jgi:sulfate/thiosulfate transport system permease protein
VASRRSAAVGSRWPRYTLRTIALVYVFFLLVLPVGVIFWRTFQDGVQPVIEALTSPPVVHAFRVTLEVAIPAVVLNTIFGVGAAILLTRHDFWGKRAFNAFIDLPLAVSPVVVGLALILVYGRLTPVGAWFSDRGFDIIFALPGMIMATVFVSLPLVVRAVEPVLNEIGVEQEQAAWTLGANAVQTFRRVTLPAIRWALAYGMVLAFARCLGEFGAIAVVSGNVVDQTQTVTLLVQQSFENFDAKTAYVAASALALIAVLTLLAISVLRPKEETR